MHRSGRRSHRSGRIADPLRSIVLGIGEKEAFLQKKGGLCDPVAVGLEPSFWCGCPSTSSRTGLRAWPDGRIFHARDGRSFFPRGTPERNARIRLQWFSDVVFRSFGETRRGRRGVFGQTRAEGWRRSEELLPTVDAYAPEVRRWRRLLSDHTADEASVVGEWFDHDSANANRAAELPDGPQRQICVVLDAGGAKGRVQPRP